MSNKKTYTEHFKISGGSVVLSDPFADLNDDELFNPKTVKPIEHVDLWDSIPDDLPDAGKRAIVCARVAKDNKSTNVKVLDVREIVRWVDFLVLATASSSRQLKAIADDIEKQMQKVGDRSTGAEGYHLANWIALDFEDVLIHLFDPEKRNYYQLEHLWADAVEIDWHRPNEVDETDSDSISSLI